MEPTDAQWAVVKPLLRGSKGGPGKRGRPRKDDRLVLEDVLWVLRTGARWKDTLKEFAPYQTCHRRFTSWVRDGTPERLLQALVADLQARGGIDLSEAQLSGANLTGANLDGADLNRANLSKSNLTRADLGGANLSGANLSFANLTGANLHAADLSGADLTGANLFEANLLESNLTGTYLTGADLSGATMPDGSKRT